MNRRWRATGTYLDTAAIGLPPIETRTAVLEAIEQWTTGTCSWEAWTEVTNVARTEVAKLLGVAHECIAVGNNVSSLVGLIASSLPPHSSVLIPDRDFPSLSYPFLVQSSRGIAVRTAPLQDLASYIQDDTTLVAASSVQSYDGSMAPLVALREAAKAHGSKILLDVTQSCGWLPLDASQYDFVVCHSYKWLMAPRGAAFMSVRNQALGDIVPTAAGWVSDTNIYAPNSTKLNLATGARRLDTSPGWFSWIGLVASLGVIREFGVPAIYQHNVALANRMRRGLKLEEQESAVVFVSAPDAPSRLAAAGVVASSRGQHAARLAFHLYNTDADVDIALNALT